MAEGFEAFHVPQQSRRDKLRVVAQNQNHNHNNCEDAAAATLHGCAGLLPLYDPSLIPSNILTCANPLGGGGTDASKQNPDCVPSVVKEEGVNLMGYVTGFMNTASSSSSHHNPYLDPQSSLAVNVNPTSIHDINGNPFLYTAQNLRDFHQSFHGGEVVTFKSSLANESQTTGQGLSLSLSSHHPYQRNLPLELNQPRYEPTMLGEKGVGGYVVRGIIGGGAATSNDVRSSVPLGPFTGYASILKGSRFLKPAQQLLEELCDVGRGIYVDKSSENSSLNDPGMDNLSGSGIVDDSASCSDHSEHRKKKTRLISMLDEVYKRYKLYYQQMQAIVASFESVAGLGNAAPYTSFALKAMSKHFRCLKNAITDQLRFTIKALGEGSFSKDDASRFGNSDRWVHGQRPNHNSGTHEHQPVWRPQRGLPERAVAVLKAWLFEHFLHPYPTDTDKQMLAKQTGLSRSQVSNWFINARVRLWKPMVEEIHVLETRQAQKSADQTNKKPNEPLPTENDLPSDKQPQTSISQNVQDQHPLKRSRNEFPYAPDRNNEQMNVSYSNLSNHHDVGVSAAGGNSGVSLTLGLRQNNGVGLSEPFPMSIAHRFGLDVSNDGYVISGFEAPNRHYGKDMGGQLLHDFVG